MVSLWRIKVNVESLVGSKGSEPTGEVFEDLAVANKLGDDVGKDGGERLGARLLILERMAAVSWTTSCSRLMRL